jgi:hypothetical protein
MKKNKKMRNATHCSNGLAHKFNATPKKGQLWHNYGNVIMGKTTTGVFNLRIILCLNFDGLDIVTVTMM